MSSAHTLTSGKEYHSNHSSQKVNIERSGFCRKRYSQGQESSNSEKPKENSC